MERQLGVESYRAIFWHRPIIRTKQNQGVLLLSNGQELKAIVWQKKSLLELPVTGYPAQIFQKKEWLTNFLFSSRISLISDGIKGKAVHLLPSLKGGGTEIPKSLANYGGYALGNIIRESDLAIPYLQQELRTIQLKIIKITQKKERMQATAFYQSFSYDDQSQITDTYVIKINRLRQRFFDYTIQIKAYVELQNVMPVEEALPIDFKQSPIQYIHNASETEETDDLVFRNPHNIKTELLNTILKSTKKTPFYLSDFAVEQMVAGITDMLQVSGQVSVLTSFVTLSHSRVIRPVLQGQTSESLKKQAKSYRVITEAVLGGFFIGYCADLSGRDHREQNKSSSLRRVSFTCLGGIPTAKISGSLQDIYDSWKRALLGPHGGYPVSFKTVYLDDLLRENGQL